MHGVPSYAVSNGLKQKPVILSYQPPSQSSAPPQSSTDPSSPTDSMDIDDLSDILDDSDFNSDHEDAAEDMEGSFEMVPLTHKTVDPQAPVSLDGFDTTSSSNSELVANSGNSITERQSQISDNQCAICSQPLVGSLIGPVCSNHCAQKLHALNGLPIDTPNLEFKAPSRTNSSTHGSSSPFKCLGCGRTCGVTNSGLPLCSNSCAQIVQFSQYKSPNPTIHGQMSNPYRLSGHSYSSVAAVQTRSQTTPSRNKMCEVCHVRPRCQRNGKIYPTCGLTCAAGLQKPGAVEMCDFCKQRPKVFINGRTFPHCGRTCRDKARAAAPGYLPSSENLPSGNLSLISASQQGSGTCPTCLNCWKAKANPPNDEFCSHQCKTIVDRRAPVLLEIPRGHISFDSVEAVFKANWNRQNHPCPSVKKVYMVCISPEQVGKFREYGQKVAMPFQGIPGGFIKKKSQDQLRWIGLHRGCGLGNPGNLKPCDSHRCLLCSILQASYDPERYGDGVMTTNLPRAVAYLSNTAKGTSKIVLMTKVHLGRVIDLASHQIHHPSSPPPGADSVALVKYHHNGSIIDSDEILVYNCHALRPMYLIAYD